MSKHDEFMHAMQEYRKYLLLFLDSNIPVEEGKRQLEFLRQKERQAFLEYKRTPEYV